ncbi:hypothetical protein FSP39_003847 [Pinctada imbricata]|uniref:Josephin-2 n=1 Tax=Pinctada imbricata TaxID=66713 RepID=A0AA88XYJ4_PINIB|nr:hypothetical protein FSP39_003847 [Pinctada imbricata]
MGSLNSCKVEMENSCNNPKQPEVYHERQVKEMCALHALNNLFQDQRAFSKKDLDDICQKLSPGNFINPHRSLLGLGNYDVNVIMAAVQLKDCETVWFDKRKDISCLIPSNIQGFILNTPTDYRWGVVRLPFKRKHWIAIRRIGDLYYNLDSKLENPEVIGGEESLYRYLRMELEDGEKELLLVVKRDVEELGSWRKDSLPTEPSKEEQAELCQVENTELCQVEKTELCQVEKTELCQEEKGELCTEEQTQNHVELCQEEQERKEGDNEKEAKPPTSKPSIQSMEDL